MDNYPPLLIITRPRLQAEALALRLQAQKICSYIFPLLDIHPHEDKSTLQQAFERLHQFALTIFISPTAIDLALSIYHNETAKQRSAALNPTGWPTPLAVIGRGSLTTLEKWGITPLNTKLISPSAQGDETFDAEGLLHALLHSNYSPASLNGKEILIIQGNQGREVIQQKLEQDGCKLTIAQIYQRCLPQPDAATLSTLTQHLRSPHCWLLTSSEAVRNLIRLKEKHPCLQNLYVALVQHPQIAQTALQAGFKKVVPIKLGDENLIHALHHKITPMLKDFFELSKNNPH